MAELHPFGCEISYKYALKDQNINDPKFGPSGKKGILVGYHMDPGVNGQKITKCWTKSQSMITSEANMCEPGDVVKYGVKRGCPNSPVKKPRRIS